MAGSYKVVAMGEGSEEQRLIAGSRSMEDLTALSARVAALERQIESLNARLSLEVLAKSPSETPLVPAHIPAPPPPRPDTPGLAAADPGPRTSLENRLGTQVFSRLGILVVLIGAALFLKLAIDNEWIGPTGRVLAGLVAGAGLVVWSERFRRKGFGAFSYTLKAVGSGVLYLTLWAAFQLYHLLPASAALVAMLLVTAWNAYMAWAQNAEVLAAYALIGGCATPVLLASGGNHEVFLFTYMLAIDVATVALVRLRPWSRLLLGVFPATVAYFIGWYAQFYSAEQLAVTSVFIGLFFVVFATVPIRGAIASGGERSEDSVPAKPAIASVITEILLPLANAAFGSLAFYSVLQDAHHHDALPWMVLLFAMAYLGIMRLPQSAAASAVHLSLAVVLLTIAIPLKASGHWITCSWLVEGAVLLWVSARLSMAGPAQDHSPASAYKVLRALAVGALLLGFAGLMVDLLGYNSATTAFFNHHFATALVGVAAFAAAAWIALRARRAAISAQMPPASVNGVEREQHLWLQIAGGSIIAVNVIAIFSAVREISALWSRTPGNTDGDLQKALAISAFLMVYGGALLAVGFWRRSAFVRWQALILIVYTIAKTFLYDMRNLSQGYRVASFMALGVLLLTVSFAYQNDWLALREKPAPAEELQ